MLFDHEWTLGQGRVEANSEDETVAVCLCQLDLEQAQRRLIADLLTREGFTVFPCAPAESAIEKLSELLLSKIVV